jgi:hypothetical protein
MKLHTEEVELLVIKNRVFKFAEVGLRVGQHSKARPHLGVKQFRFQKRPDEKQPNEVEKGKVASDLACNLEDRRLFAPVLLTFTNQIEFKLEKQVLSGGQSFRVLKLNAGCCLCI